MVYMYTGDVHEIVAGKKCLPVLTHTLTLGSRHDLKWRTIRKLHLSLLTWILKGSLDNHASATAEPARTAEIPLPHATTPTCRKNWSRFQTQQWSGVDSGSRCTLGTKYILWAHHSPSIRSEWVHLKAIYPTTASPTTYNLLQSPFKTPEKAQQNRFSMFFPKDSGQSTKGLLSGAPGDCKMWAIRGGFSPHHMPVESLVHGEPMHPHRLHMDHRRCSSWPEPCPLERPRGPKTLVPVRWHPQLRRRISLGPSNLQFDLQQTPSKRRLSNHIWGCAANTTGNGVHRVSTHCPQAQHSRPSIDLHLPTSTNLCESEYLADRKIWHLRLWGHREHPESSSNAGWHLRYILYKLLSHLLLPRIHGHFLVRPCKRKQKCGAEELSLIV